MTDLVQVDLIELAPDPPASGCSFSAYSQFSIWASPGNSNRLVADLEQEDDARVVERSIEPDERSGGRDRSCCFRSYRQASDPGPASDNWVKLGFVRLAASPSAGSSVATSMVTARARRRSAPRSMCGGQALVIDEPVVGVVLALPSDLLPDLGPRWSEHIDLHAGSRSESARVHGHAGGRAERTPASGFAQRPQAGDRLLFGIWSPASATSACRRRSARSETACP